MKTIILIIMFMASITQAQSFYHKMFGFIDVTSTNQSQYDMKLIVSHLTDDYGTPKDADQRHICVRAPLKKDDLILKSLRLMVGEPGPELAVPLAYSEEGSYATVEFLMALPLLKTGILFALYENSDEYSGAGYCFELIKFEANNNTPSKPSGAGHPPQGVGTPDP